MGARWWVPSQQRRDWVWAVDNIDAKDISAIRIRELNQSCRAVRIFHDSFGFIASSEGAPLALQNIRRALESEFEIEMVPRYAGSFIALTHIDKTDLPKKGIQVANPQMILAHRMPIKRLQLASEHHPLEKYDFNSKGGSSFPLGKQIRKTVIRIDKEGELNSVIGYIAVDFDPHHKSRRREQNHTGKTRTENTSLTSLTEDMSPTNWSNPVVILQQSLWVKRGDEVRIHTQANIGTTSPSYTLTLERREENNEIWGLPQSVSFNTQALYPTFPKKPIIPERKCSEEENPLLHKTAEWTRQSQEENRENTQETPHNQTTGRRLECGAGKRHTPQKVDKQINTDIELALAENKGKRETPWQGTSMTLVINHLTREQTKLQATNASPPFFSPEIEHIVARHLHLDGTVNEHIANVRVGSRWYSPGSTKEELALGALSGELAPFLHEHMTWINPRENGNTHTNRAHLQEMIKAVDNSNRARIAGLFEVEPNTVKELSKTAGSQTRICILTTYQPGTLPTQHPSINRIELEMDKSTNKQCLHLILIEKGEVNPIDHAALREDLQQIVPGSYVTIAWPQTSKNVTQSFTRTLHTLHPTLNFIHPVQTLTAQDKNKSKVETHSRIAAALGILPKDMARQMRYHHHNLGSEGLQGEQRKKLTCVLRNASIRVYEEYIKWIKREKYGVS